MAVDVVGDSLWAQTMEPFVMLGVHATLAAEDDILAMQGTPRTPANEGSRIANLRTLVHGRLGELTVQTVLHQQNVVEELRREAASLWKDVDLIVAPVAAVLPPKVTDVTYQVGERRLESHEAYLYSAMTNVLGLPSLAFPTGKASDGFPVGLQVISPRYGEGMMIRFLQDIGLTDRLQMIDGYPSR
jgi:Asp-tRNA(Asn)/Glu-tRNA(Gln) amidotransferase A subunit family amidase